MDTVARDTELRAQGHTFMQSASELDLDKASAWCAVQTARADVARPAGRADPDPE